MSIVHHVESHKIDSPNLDHYGSRGVVISRDTASLVHAALMRDVHELEHRGGEANLAHALEQRMVARQLLNVLANS